MDVAAALGVHVAAVGQWERGVNTPRRDTAERLDAELGAHGALLEAFGYVSSPVGGTGSLEHRVETLEAELADVWVVLRRVVEVQEIATATVRPDDPAVAAGQQ